LQLGALEAGKFWSPDGGRTVIYARQIAGDELLDVFVQYEEGERVVAILAASGERSLDPSTGDFSFVLRDGRRYEGVPGDNEFLVVDFGEGGFPVRAREDETKEVETLVASKPTAALLRSSTPEDRAELEWRLSTPISMIVLALLAVPLSRSASPREGRYARLGIGLLAYIVYGNLLAIGRLWLERDIGPEWMGLWWVHLTALSIAVLLLVRQSGVWAPTPAVAT
jgi:lipopolysaccharide export system permease protein